jgi:hypothetical protein
MLRAIIIIKIKNMKTILFLFTLVFINTAWTCPTGTIVSNYTGNGAYNINLTTNFSATTYDSLIKVTWNFGDNSGTYIGMATNVTHSYVTHGTYIVSATVLCVNSTLDSCTQVFYDTLSYNPIPCPIASFTASKNYVWCNTGTVTIGWAYCNWDYNQDTYPDNYWTPNSVVWNMSDGNTATTAGSAFLTYTVLSPDTLIISATGYFTGLNGETCAVPLYNLDLNTSQDPCLILSNPSTVYTDYMKFAPKFAKPNLSSSLSTVCVGESFSLTDLGVVVPSVGTGWSYSLLLNGDSIQSNSGLPTNGSVFYTSQFTETGQNTFELRYAYSGGCYSSSVITIEVIECDTACTDCSTFKPIPGERYWVSGWVKENQPSAVKSYLLTSLKIEFLNGVTNLGNVSFSPTGEIIEGWQRVVGSFTIPSNATDLHFILKNTNTSIASYFDDIRIHPFNASMKSYVYDPVTLWLTAELDDNNYATFYEYDKEGQLIRIKKETARGIMTIQESRSNNPKVE